MVKPIPPFTPKAFNPELATVMFVITVPDEQLYPHQIQTGSQVMLVPTGTALISLVFR
jgi:hypothetical protein